MECVQNDRLDHLGLPACIPHIPRPSRTPKPHQRRPKDDGEVVRRHPILRAVFSHLMQVQRQLPQSRIIRIGQIIDDGVKGVAADDVIVYLGGGQKGLVVCRSEQWIG